MRQAGEDIGGTKGGGPRTGGELLPLVYEDLLRLATRQLAEGWAGQPFEPAELVHEAWLRVAAGGDRRWNHRGHFFGAAAEAMRRILVEAARRAGRLKRGGGYHWVDVCRVQLPAPVPEEAFLALEEALGQLAAVNSLAVELIRLRFFVGLTHAEAARQLGLSRSSADRAWGAARVWLLEWLRLAGPPVRMPLEGPSQGPPQIPEASRRQRAHLRENTTIARRAGARTSAVARPG